MFQHFESRDHTETIVGMRAMKILQRAVPNRVQAVGFLGHAHERAVQIDSRDGKPAVHRELQEISPSAADVEDRAPRSADPRQRSPKFPALPQFGNSRKIPPNLVVNIRILIPDFPRMTHRIRIANSTSRTNPKLDVANGPDEC